MNEHTNFHFHPAPLWSLMVGDTGRFLILLAVACFGLSFMVSALAKLEPAKRSVGGVLSIVAVVAFAALAASSIGAKFYYGTAFIAAATALTLLLGAVTLRGLAKDGERTASRMFLGGCLCLFGTITCLGVLFANDQFHYEYVFGHGELRTAFKYKIAGIWAGQEGSFLLWATMSAIFGLIGLRISGIYRRWFVASYALFLLALCGIMAYESPFNVWEEALNVAKASPWWATEPGRPVWAPGGRGLAPSLENYWVVIHPPTIFAGFGSLTLLFCMSVSAMLTGNAKEWVPITRPWTLVSVAILGLGLSMGGFWAYETLGWGGFWAWDPVENVSFVPWCFVAALVHGLIVQVTHKKWISTNLLLAGLPFLLFTYGTFMTRSGFLEDQSVHSFAEMNRTALWLLVGFLSLAVVSFTGLWLWKGLQLGKTVDPPPIEGVHREGAYRWSSVLLAGLGVATAVGMSVPLIQSLLGQSPKRVEEHAYHLILVWFFVPIMLLMAAGPFISWRGMPLGKLLARLLNIFSISLGVLGILMFLGKRSSLPELIDLSMDNKIAFAFGKSFWLFAWVLFLTWLCMFAFIGNMWRIVEMWKRSKGSIGGFVSHIGVAVMLGGLIISRGFEYKEELFVGPELPGFGKRFQAVFTGRTRPVDSPYAKDNQIVFDIHGPTGEFKARLNQYYNRTEQDDLSSQTSWPYIHRTWWHDIYVAANEVRELGEPIVLEVGKSLNLGEVQILYEGMEMEGEPGQAGTKFIAKLVTTGQNDVATRSAPYLQMVQHEGESQMHPEQPYVTIAQGIDARLFKIDAATKAASVQLRFNPPRYPMEVFYKPMTILVWVGTGILTLGGLLSAWYRRRPRASVPEPEEVADSTVEHIREDAPAPVA